MATLSSGAQGSTETPEQRRRRLAREQQAIAGFTAGRTTPTKATTAPAIAASLTSLGAPAPATRWGDTLASVNSTAGGVPPTTASQMQAAYAPVQAASVPAPVAAASYSSNPSGSGWNGGTTDTIDGYLKQFGYTPQGLMGVYDNPQPLAEDVLGTRGIENSGMAAQLAELFDHFLGAQFVNNRGGDPTDNDTLNFIANAMQQAITPGGQYVDPAYYLNTILGATNQDANPLGAYLGAGTPEQQISNTNRLASQGLVGMNPYSQNAYASALQRQGQQYLGGTMKGDPNAQSYVDYLRQSPFANWF